MSTYIDNLIDYWNSLPNTSKHRGKNTKIYSSASMKLRHLIHGKFVEKYTLCNSVINQIDDVYLDNYKFTIDEIKQGMNLLSLLCTPGYSLNGKPYRGNSKTLDGLLYNPIINSSIFLIVLSNPPVLNIKTEADLNDLNFDKEYFDMFYIMLDFNDRKPYTYTMLTKKIQAVLSFHRKIQKHLKYDRLYNPAYFIELYRDFLKSNFSYFKVGLVGINSFSWKLFCDYVYNEYGENLL